MKEEEKVVGWLMGEVVRDNDVVGMVLFEVGWTFNRNESDLRPNKKGKMKMLKSRKRPPEGGLYNLYWRDLPTAPKEDDS